MKRLFRIHVNLLVLFMIPGLLMASPGKDWTVAKVKIEGLETVSVKMAKAVLSVRPANIRPWVKDQVFAQSLVDADIKNLTQLMEQEGYFESQIDFTLNENPDREKVSVIYKIVEGPPILVDSMDMEGLDGLSENLREKIIEFTPLEKGERLRTEPYGQAKDKIIDLLNTHGYPHAAVTGSIMVNKQEKTAAVTLKVDPKGYYLFGPASVAGLEKTNPNVILSRVTFEEGKMYTRKELEETQREIFSLGFLSKVGVKTLETKEQVESAAPPTPENPGSLPLEITGEYKKFKSVRFGIGYGTEEKLRLSAGWRHRHFTSQATQLDFSVKTSEILQSAQAELWQPYFFSKKQEFKNTLGAKREDEISYIDLSFFNEASVTRKLSRYWSGTIGHQLEMHRPEEYSLDLQGDETEAENNYLVSSLALGFERDSRPKVLIPRSGTFLSTRYWYGSSSLGSEIDYYKLSVEGSILIPLGQRFVLASRAGFAGIETLEDTETVPLFMRLFSGGTHSVRGYEYQHLGPVNDDGEYMGGQSRWEGSIELRFPIYKKITGVAFTDCGSVLEDPFSFDGSSFRYTAGPGIRYESPVGALSLDVGYQLNPQDDYADTYRVHFSVGQAF
ncbi:surface antigen (D15) [Desulfatibacillum aliphaticivorans]|uniref:Surface antigen (D15) n=1 Tax=Desulfatibacillum aliphaticivorans TaxID=218208 RepID=B8FGH6_DESAL|nr:BamA/TamA family outer membrane protein [Desulfatibacillum aliphaticivorans]ACL04885.1 surface antigen (D15) [Desulfatibacillum aliphaticivorans]